jgi:hypothetical protein
MRQKLKDHQDGIYSLALLVGMIAMIAITLAPLVRGSTLI